MHIDLSLDFDSKNGIWTVWNATNTSEFTIKFDCQEAAISFMVQLIAEVKI